ncbi:unnamed protein product, partial [Ectocarpus sp. 12 AP-2014]
GRGAAARAGGAAGTCAPPPVGGGGVEDSQRLSPAMREHFRTAKKNIDANIIHHSGGVAAPRGGSGKFPYSSPLILPKCATMQNSSGLPKLSPFLLKPLFAWIPEYLFPELALAGIPCPRCGKRGSPDGWNPKGPRRVFMEEDVGYIIGFRYKCERCVEYNGTVEESEEGPTSFNAWDVGCLDRLPDYVSKEFPFILTHRSGIDIRLVDRLADDLVHGKDFSAAAKYIRQAHTTKFMVNQLKYVSLADARRSSRVSLFGAAPVPEKFGSFDDTEKYSGAVPSDYYLRDVWRTYFSELPVLEVEGVKWTRKDYLHRVHQRWDGTVLAGDASFKFAKIIRLGATAHGERTRPVHGIFTVFNEYEQVFWQRPMKSNALGELMEELKLLFVGRYLRNGFKLPLLWNSGIC